MKRFTALLLPLVLFACQDASAPDAALEAALQPAVGQAAPEKVVYLDDRQMFTEVAGRLGMRVIWHRETAETRAALAKLGLNL